MGNDIVDRSLIAGRNRARNARFLCRVFAKEEQTAIRSADDPDGMLHALWAAKESAYKIESAILGPQVFAHRLYGCRIVSRQADERSLPRRIVVACPERNRGRGDPALYAHLLVDADDGALHAYGFASRTNGRCGQTPPPLFVAGRRRLSRLSGVTSCRFSEAERRSIRNRSSAEVRRQAKEALAASLKLDLSRLEIIRPTVAGRPQPPLLQVDGKRSGIGVSLSHHGDWISWCFGARRGRIASQIRA